MRQSRQYLCPLGIYEVLLREGQEKKQEEEKEEEEQKEEEEAMPSRHMLREEW